jgi:hypothetical protein
VNSWTYEVDPHPLLDLSPLEQVVLLKAERHELRTAVVQVGEGLAITHLRELGLIEVLDGAWIPTRPRGCLVARVLERLETARVTRRSRSELEKKEAMLSGIKRNLAELVAEVHALPMERKNPGEV